MMCKSNAAFEDGRVNRNHSVTIVLLKDNLMIFISSIPNVKAEEIEYKNETSHSIYLGFLLYYITLTYYYILADTFR